ncbi:Mis12-Mtw1 protein family-domain-containing protein [Jimgerdemannia flammicorona]|uniref:Mis12-Mtw1 protein family-domain-containing protein n=1 Tax=Jimgerdemannia flammicorona TaxID=994334 RepID=A0A433DFD3_9FUNG|nr:Mis12-Mtw1 protein family-domain-containing protein [Jimgerdemannia flammicorona]
MPLRSATVTMTQQQNTPHLLQHRPYHAKRKARDDDSGRYNDDTKENRPTTSRGNKKTKQGAMSDEEEDNGFIFKRTRSRTSLGNTQNVVKTAQSAQLSASSAVQPPIKNTAITTRKTGVLEQHFQQGQQLPQKQRRPVDTIVAIPINETPMIRKNQEIRNGKRRSSFSMRGKRASSIGNGFVALPHASILPEDFYKHISPELPGPVRMKQLLAWCGRRAIDAQRRTGSGKQAAEFAKEIQEDVMNALINSQLNTSWYHRRADHDEKEESCSSEKKLHPQNVENAQKVTFYEATLKRLEAEDSAWIHFIRRFNSLHAAVLDSCPPVPPQFGLGANEPTSGVPIESDEVDWGILEEEEREFLQKYCDEKQDNSEDHLASQVTNNQECQVNQLYHILYNATQFNQITRQYCEELFRRLLTSLDSQQHQGLVRAPEAMDILRTLARTSS